MEAPRLDDRVCSRCGVPAGESRWCSGCGLNLASHSPLPTAEEYAARVREREWLAGQVEPEVDPSPGSPRQQGHGPAVGRLEAREEPLGEERDPAGQSDALAQIRSTRRRWRGLAGGLGALLVLGVAAVAFLGTRDSGGQSAPVKDLRAIEKLAEETVQDKRGITINRNQTTPPKQSEVDPTWWWVLGFTQSGETWAAWLRQQPSQDRVEVIEAQSPINDSTPRPEDAPPDLQRPFSD